MSDMKNKDKELDVKRLNDIILISKKILKIAYIIVIVLAIYTLIILSKEMHIVSFLLTILKIISPLFIGFLIAWLFNPFVTWLNKKGVRRSLGTTFTYVLILAFFAVVIGAIIPMLSTQINDFAQMVPNIFEMIKSWITGVFDNLKNIEGIDATSIQNNLFNSIEGMGTSLTNSLPKILVSLVTSFFSGIGIFVIGLVIGFYLLISFDNNVAVIAFLPKKIQKLTSELMEEIDTSLRSFVTGALLDSLFIFIITSIGFALVGLKAPLLFGLFCGITNIIPYAGPYIGGIPAVIVGFSQGIPTGLFTLLVVFVIQFLEGNFLQPLIMSKTTKLHPVTIMIGLLVFGYFWGILGMAVATPVIASVKAIAVLLNEKYDILNFNN